MSARRYLVAVGLVAILGIAAAWVYAATMRMWFLEGGYPVWVAKQDMLRTCDLGDVVVIGDSRAEAAIQPAMLTVPAVNLGFGGTTPAESLVFVRRLLRCPKRPRLLIYAHSLAAFMAVNPFLWRDSVRYGYIGLHDLWAMRATAERLHDTTFAEINTGDGLTGVPRDVVYASGFPTVFVASALKSHFIDRHAANRALLAQVRQAHGFVAFAGTAPPHRLGLDATVHHFTPSPMLVSYFDRTLAMLQAAGVDVVVLTVPDSVSTLRAIPPPVASAFAAFLRAHVAGRPGIALANDGVSGWPDGDFVDGMHMNAVGSAAFSGIMAGCLTTWLQVGPGPCALPPP